VLGEYVRGATALPRPWHSTAAMCQCPLGVDNPISEDGALKRCNLPHVRYEALMRREAQMPDLEYKVIVQEPLVVVLPSDHQLASCDTITLQDIVDEIFLGMSESPPTLQVVINDYPRGAGIAGQLTRLMTLDVDVVGCVHARRNPGSRLCKEFSSIVSDQPPARRASAPTINLVVGYNKANTSSTLQLFLSRLDDLVLLKNGRVLTGN
jgi:LysR family transcriptional regulator, hca operon transcriptional activator